MPRLTFEKLTESPLAYGCWRFAGTDIATARSKIEAALEAGMQIIDTADIYGYGDTGFGAAEKLLGDVLQEAPELRDQMILATKGGVDLPTPYKNSRKYLLDACDASLERLGVAQVDLYYVHRPDLLTHPEEVAEALDELVESGKVGAIGVSNYSVTQLLALDQYLDKPIVAVQNEFSLFHQDPITDGVLDWCMETGAAFFAWSPLAGGRLPKGEALTPQEKDILLRVAELAEDHGASLSDIALAFLRRHPARPVAIIGSQSPARITSSTDHLDLTLTAREWYDMIEAYRGMPMP